MDSNLATVGDGQTLAELLSPYYPPGRLVTDCTNLARYVSAHAILMVSRMCPSATTSDASNDPDDVDACELAQLEAECNCLFNRLERQQQGRSLTCLALLIWMLRAMNLACYWIIRKGASVDRIATGAYVHQVFWVCEELLGDAAPLPPPTENMGAAAARRELRRVLRKLERLDVQGEPTITLDAIAQSLAGSEPASKAAEFIIAKPGQKGVVIANAAGVTHDHFRRELWRKLLLPLGFFNGRQNGRGSGYFPPPTLDATRMPQTPHIISAGETIPSLTT